MKPSYRQAHGIFGLLNLALSAPMIYLMLGLPLVMRQHGWSGLDIGLFQLAGLPALAKVLLAVPVQRWQCGPRPSLRWLGGLGLAYVLVLILLASQSVDSPRPLLFTLVMACALLSTWADIPASALTMAILPPEQRMRAGGVRSAAMFAGAMVGGGLMLLAQQAWGWAAPFWLLAGVLALALIWASRLREVAAPRPGTPAAGLSLRSFFRQPGASGWALLLLAYFPFVATAWIYLKPLLLDHGFAPEQVAGIVGLGGGGLGALVSLITTYRMPREQLMHSLPLSALANALALGALTLAAWLSAPAWVWIVASLTLAAAMGVSAALAFAVMMEFARQHHQAIDYGAQASLFTLGRLAVPPLAGVLLDWQGYPGMLLGLTLAALLVAGLCLTQAIPLAGKRLSLE